MCARVCEACAGSSVRAQRGNRPPSLFCRIGFFSGIRTVNRYAYEDRMRIVHRDRPSFLPVRNARSSRTLLYSLLWGTVLPHNTLTLNGGQMDPRDTWCTVAGRRTMPTGTRPTRDGLSILEPKGRTRVVVSWTPNHSDCHTSASVWSATWGARIYRVRVSMCASYVSVRLSLNNLLTSLEAAKSQLQNLHAGRRPLAPMGARFGPWGS